MAERQVTVDSMPYLVPRPFIVIATQNPVEHGGTYDLPEAQLDRFMMQHRASATPTTTPRSQVVSQRHRGAARPTSSGR